MTKLCFCGECEDAIVRAFGLAEKMMKDNECPIFMAAVAEAMTMIAYKIQRNFVAKEINDEYEKGDYTEAQRDVAKAVMFTELEFAFADIPDKMHEVLVKRNNEYSGDVIRISNDHRERRRKEQEL